MEKQRDENGNLNCQGCQDYEDAKGLATKADYMAMAIDARKALFEAACHLDDLTEVIHKLDLECLACLTDSIRILRGSENTFYDVFINCEVVKGLCKKELSNG